MFRVFIFSKSKSKQFRAYEVLFQNDDAQNFEILRQLTQKLFVDPVCEDIVIDEDGNKKNDKTAVVIWMKPGVYDAEGEMALYAARKLGLGDQIDKIRFGRGVLAKEITFNPLVERVEKW